MWYNASLSIIMSMQWSNHILSAVSSRHGNILSPSRQSLTKPAAGVHFLQTCHFFRSFASTCYYGSVRLRRRTSYCHQLAAFLPTFRWVRLLLASQSPIQQRHRKPAEPQFEMHWKCNVFPVTVSSRLISRRLPASLNQIVTTGPGSFVALHTGNNLMVISFLSLAQWGCGQITHTHTHTHKVKLKATGWHFTTSFGQCKAVHLPDSFHVTWTLHFHCLSCSCLIER